MYGYRGMGDCQNGIDPQTGNPCFTATATASAVDTSTLENLPLIGPWLSQTMAGSVNRALSVTPAGGGIIAPQSFTDWVNQNSKWVLIGGAAFLGLMLLSGRRR